MRGSFQDGCLNELVFGVAGNDVAQTLAIAGIELAGPSTDVDDPRPSS
jgi:hypothetical protein